MKEFVSKSVEDTCKFASEFANSLDGHHQGGEALVVGLYGELGAGKTTFMKCLAKALGIKETIQSPTFVIMKSYKLHIPDSRFKLLIHIDAYRLDSGEDLKKLGWDKLTIDPQTLICIEWPEKVAEIMPPHIMLKFEHVENRENERKIGIA